LPRITFQPTPSPYIPAQKSHVGVVLRNIHLRKHLRIHLRDVIARCAPAVGNLRRHETHVMRDR
jgi:hypothetical protein